MEGDSLPSFQEHAETSKSHIRTAVLKWASLIWKTCHVASLLVVTWMNSSVWWSQSWNLICLVCNLHITQVWCMLNWAWFGYLRNIWNDKKKHVPLPLILVTLAVFGEVIVFLMKFSESWILSHSLLITWFEVSVLYFTLRDTHVVCHILFLSKCSGFPVTVL